MQGDFQICISEPLRQQNLSNKSQELQDSQSESKNRKTKSNCSNSYKNINIFFVDMVITTF